MFRSIKLDLYDYFKVQAVLLLELNKSTLVLLVPYFYSYIRYYASDYFIMSYTV